jgi:hypothetical protein
VPLCAIFYIVKRCVAGTPHFITSGFCAQVQLFAETFTEQLSYIGLLRADSVEAFEAAKQKFITGLTVREFGDQLSV